MKENQQDTHRTNKAHQKKEHTEKRAPQRAPIGELVAHQLVRNKPPYENTCEESADGQEQLSGDEIEKVEQRHAENGQRIACPQRK